MFSHEQLFAREIPPIRPGKDDDGFVKPLTVISVDEVERVLPNMEAGSITWPELLNERFDLDRVRGFSVHNALHDLSEKRKVEIARNKFLLDGFDEIFAEIVRDTESLPKRASLAEYRTT